MTESLKETKELLKFVIDVVEAVDQSISDGALSLLDATNFVDPIFSVGAAFRGINNVPKEISELTPDQIKELCDYVTGELRLSDEKVEDTVKKLLESGLRFYELAQFIKNAKV